MNRLNVNPTRMELSKLKKQLEVSVSGHKLLKDKQDELMRRFIILIRKCNHLREKAEKRLMELFQYAAISSSPFAPEVVENSMINNSSAISVNIGRKNVMGIHVPTMKFQVDEEAQVQSMQLNMDMDQVYQDMHEVFPILLELAECEKSCSILADEIEKVRRRVNALEYMTIPQLRETIRYIKMKLDDGERDRIVRLLKVKNMQ